MVKTIVFISDLHCGSVYGITPEEHFSHYDNYRELQEETWNKYCAIADRWVNPDVLIVNGDCIEGAQTKQGGAELITPDRNVQSDMAVIAINKFRAKNIFMTFGTRYHCSEQAEDFEYVIANKLNAKIEGRLFLEVEGMTFDIRHKVGSSSIPHGRATSLLRENMWNLIKESEDIGPKVDVIVRSHVHYHIWIEDGKRVMFTTPALQLARGRYGSRECSGKIHWGAIRLTVDNGEIIRKEVNLCSVEGNKPQILKVS